MLLLCALAPTFLSATSVQKELTVNILQWTGEDKLYVRAGSITIPLSALSNETTIEQLKKKIASKAGIPLKKQNGMVLENNYKELQDDKTCQHYNLTERNDLDLSLILRPDNAVMRLFRNIAWLPAIAKMAIFRELGIPFVLPVIKPKDLGRIAIWPI